jgi:hypothetical protein
VRRITDSARSAGVPPAVVRASRPHTFHRVAAEAMPTVSLYARCFILTPNFAARKIPLLADRPTDSPTFWARNRASASTTCVSLSRKLARSAHSRDDGHKLFAPAASRKRRLQWVISNWKD